MRATTGNSYEDVNRLNAEAEHLRDSLREAKKVIDRNYDDMRQYRLEILKLKRAIEDHDDACEDTCYSIRDKMVESE